MLNYMNFVDVMLSWIYENVFICRKYRKLTSPEIAIQD